MQPEPSRRAIESYYDGRIGEKILDFTRPLPRIEAAIQTLAEWAPADPRRILEIGCGIGATSWRMARAWPEAEVIGIDLSPASIEVASTCFKLPNLSYRAGFLEEQEFDGEFDLILLMDVYEHIASSGRPSLHAALKRLLSEESRLILMIPTPAHQNFLRAHHRQGLQPVDEDISFDQIAALAEAVSARVLYYREIGVWHYGDYFHTVLGRCENLPPVAFRLPRHEGMAAVKQLLKRLLGRASPDPTGRRDYLGIDLLNPRAPNPARRFHVSIGERQRLAEAWREARRR
jgi:trans-aconitate methyltransferase